MSETMIKVEGLGKRYTISHERKEGYTALRDVIGNKMKALVKKRTDDFVAKEDFWALKDVNFEVKQGEAVGIIGRNGAGKSTLLKLLSRITEPTHGRIGLNGRVASLLEVGTGFHPELTGRENLFLNGAILGMSRGEIKSKFDEIVDFSGVEKFLDTPVKRYSSGMFIRLAFAVAAHLEPEILVVDEVLAVGDADFQKKCLGKMNDVSKNQGRTVLLVSHQINAIKSLCSTGVLLESGTVKIAGPIDAVISEYARYGAAANSYWSNETSALKSRIFEPTKFYVVDENFNIIKTVVENNRKIGVVIEGIVGYTESDLCIGFALYTMQGDVVCESYQTDTRQDQWPKLSIGENKMICWLPAHFLNEGEYRLEMLCGLYYKEWILNPGRKNGPTVTFEIKGGLSESPNWLLIRPGITAPVLNFTLLDD